MNEQQYLRVYAISHLGAGVFFLILAGLLIFTGHTAPLPFWSGYGVGVGLFVVLLATKLFTKREAYLQAHDELFKSIHKNGIVRAAIMAFVVAVIILPFIILGKLSGATCIGVSLAIASASYLIRVGYEILRL